MENYNLHRRAQSGWHPTSYSRKPTPDAPRERNYEAILEAAKRPPVGYWEDAPRGIQFGESAKGRPAGFELAREGSSPSSPAIPDGALGDDPYEPIGTMPVVGDMVVVLESDGTPYKDDDAGKPQRVKAVYEDECETDFCAMTMEWFKTMSPVNKIRNRILRRTKAATGAKYYHNRVNLFAYSFVGQNGHFHTRDGGKWPCTAGGYGSDLEEITQAQFIAKLREWNHPALAEFEAVSHG